MQCSAIGVVEEVCNGVVEEMSIGVDRRSWMLDVGTAVQCMQVHLYCVGDAGDRSIIFRAVLQCPLKARHHHVRAS